MANRLGWVGIPALAFLLSAVTFWQAAEGVAYNPDESQWLATTSYLAAVVRGDLSASTWKLDYWTLTQPPLARYTLGTGLLAAGITPGSTNVPWQFQRSYDDNVAAGAMPAREVLLVGRHTSAVLGALGVAGLAAGAVALGGPGAGLLVAVLLAFNPLLLVVIPRSMAEGTLLAAIGWSFWSLAVRLPRGRWLLLLCLATGASTGLAIATKLKAALSLVAILLGGFSRSVERRRWALLSAGIAAAVFFLVNPALWYAPIDGPLGMYALRMVEMAEQASLQPLAARQDLLSRLLTVLAWLWEADVTLGSWWHLPLDLLLAVVGARQLVLGRFWSVAAWAAAYLVGVTVMLSVVWDRYLLGPVVVVEVLAALGLQHLLATVLNRLSRVVSPAKQGGGQV